jgi:hypothetical protein
MGTRKIKKELKRRAKRRQTFWGALLQPKEKAPGL